MSRRARELDALNLGQGFPDYDIDPRLTELVAAAMSAGHNQYAPMEGLPALRERIAAKLHPQLRAAASIRKTRSPSPSARPRRSIRPCRPWSARATRRSPLIPAYDSYEPAVRLAGGRCLRVPLAQPGFRYDWERVRAAINARTRLMLFNSPHNPACTVAGAADLDALAQLIAARDILVLSDEVYEHVVFDGAQAPLGADASGAAPRAASRCFPSARPCTPPGCGSATASRRRR